MLPPTKERIAMTNNTKVIQCKCKSQFQDSEYGANQRLANVCAKKGKVAEKLGAKCTVCGVIHTS